METPRTRHHRSHAKETYLTALSQSQLCFLKVIFFLSTFNWLFGAMRNKTKASDFEESNIWAALDRHWMIYSYVATLFLRTSRMHQKCLPHVGGKDSDHLCFSLRNTGSEGFTDNPVAPCLVLSRSWVHPQTSLLTLIPSHSRVGVPAPSLASCAKLVGYFTHQTWFLHSKMRKKNV